MKNSLTDLTNHLFVALERLNEENLTPEQIRAELGRANAVATVAREVISAGRLAVDASRHLAHDPALRPRLLGLDRKELSN